MRQQQRGISLIGLLFMGSVLGSGVLVGLQVAPTVIEYLAVQKAVKKAAVGTTVADVRSIFDKAAQIDDIRSISGQDLEISKQGDRVIVGFAYQREIHLSGPAYLVLKYKGSSR
ncbi:MAG: DUF4845 domain-containing protein [Burkholderiaceae bacterium]|nr:DUF4845 domain-containing protein [Burkholderiaceae bacterium]MDZ4162456.1 DUF4845 domain-containing protein [Burkholderiales bacterium]